MTLRNTLKTSTALAVLAACGLLELGAGEARAQLMAVPAYETVYVPARVKFRFARRPRAVVLVPTAPAPTTYIASSPTVVTETRYVQTTPIVTETVIQPRSYVPTTMQQYVPTTYSTVDVPVLQTVPVLERRTVVYPY